MALPHDVQSIHVEKALEYIDEHGVPPKRQPTKYVLRRGGRRYPPKYVICVAHRFIDGKEWPNIFGGGSEANNFLIVKGFKIYDKRTGRRLRVQSVDEDEESRFPEGGKSYRQHVSRERDTAIAKKVKERRLAEVGELRCDICGVLFPGKYGSVGSGYIEAHHTVPVSELDAKRKTKIEELALVCSNCHRMLHRRRPWLTMANLRAILESAETHA